MSDTKKISAIRREQVEKLNAQFSEVRDFIFIDYRGQNVEQMSTLRKKLSALDAKYRVIKNRFAKISFSELNKASTDDFLAGPTAVVLSNGEIGPVLKELLGQGKNFPLQLKGALIDGLVFDKKSSEQIAALPPRDHLLAMLLSAMKAPIQKCASALNDSVGRLARVLQAIADKK